MTDVLPTFEGLLTEQDRHIWCGDTDSTGRYVCRRVRDHALDWHGARNDAGGIHQWKAAGADGGRENMLAAVPAADPASYPIGTVVVHPDDDRNSPTARRRVAVDDSTHAGPYKGCRWERLTGVGVHDGGCDPIHSAAVVGWWVQPLAELAVVLGQPKAKLPVDLAMVYGYELGQRDATEAVPAAVDGDMRQKAILALAELVSEFISPNEFGGYDIHYGELVDIVLDVVRPELERRDTEIADHWRAAEVDESTKAELAKENNTLRAEVGHLTSGAGDTPATPEVPGE